MWETILGIIDKALALILRIKPKTPGEKVEAGKEELREGADDFRRTGRPKA